MANDDSQQPVSPRLEMCGVSKRFGATRALHGVNLNVRPGEVLALVGENGAGKSTLMKILSGAHPPDEGEMRLDGQPYRPRNPLDARRSGVAMIYQELSLAPHLSVMENILLGIEPTAGPFIRWPEMRQPGHGGAPRDRYRRRAAGNAGRPAVRRAAADGRDRAVRGAREPRARAR